jgi:hypothetical protein
MRLGLLVGDFPEITRNPTLPGHWALVVRFRCSGRIIAKRYVCCWFEIDSRMKIGSSHFIAPGDYAKGGIVGFHIEYVQEQQPFVPISREPHLGTTIERRSVTDGDE